MRARGSGACAARLCSRVGARGVVEVPCPPGSIEVAPGTSIQSASDVAGDNASICLKNGTHRMQVARPRQGQSFQSRQRRSPQWCRRAKMVLGCRYSSCGITGCAGVPQFGDCQARGMRDRPDRPEPGDGERPEVQETPSNTVRENDMTFEGGACAGGVSDAKPGDENYAIIADGNNRFDANVYRVPKASTAKHRFVFGTRRPRLGRMAQDRSRAQRPPGDLLTPPRQASLVWSAAAGQRTACTPFVEPLVPLPLRAAGIGFSRHVQRIGQIGHGPDGGLRPVAGADLAQDRFDC